MKKNLSWVSYVQWNSVAKILIMFKCILLLILISVVDASSKGYSQTRINLNINGNSSLKKVLKDIEKKSDYRFLYTDDLIPDSRAGVISFKDASLEEVMYHLLEDTGLSYKTTSNNLVIIAPRGSTNQAVTIVGIVTDAKKLPLPGVSVKLKGTTTGATTDIDGKYRIVVPDNSAVLVFSFVGFVNQEQTVGSRTTINVTLQESATNLDEVVVVGYGVQKKVTLTGSVVDVKGSDLVKNPTPNVTNTLQGRLPGLIASNRSGEPGRDDAQLLIRGKSTLGNTAPLIIIDGVERDGLGQLDANNIESISVLKDASAAIYGARAANGVILVTTKRGSSGKAAFEFSTNQGFSQPTRIPQMMDAALYAQVRNEADLYNGATSLIYSEADIQQYKDGSDPIGHPNTDWVEETLKPWTLQNNHFLSVRGGSEKIKYFFSFGAQNQDNSFKNNPTKYNQYSVRSNIDANINKQLTVSLDLAGRYEKRNYPSTGTWVNFVNILSAEPTLIAKYPNGMIAAGRFGENPLLRDQVGSDNTDNYPITSTLSFKYDAPFVKGLNFSGSYNYDLRNQFQKVFQKPYYYYRYNSATDTYEKVKAALYSSPTVSDRFDRWIVKTYNLKLNYQKTIGRHSLGLLAGWEQQINNFNWTSAFRRNFASTELPQINYGSSNVVDQSTGGNATETARNNYFGRLNYNFKEKYLAELLFRYDGSPNFPEDRRYGFFPGISLGWRISEEAFIKNNLAFINNMKLRASYGEMGNDRVDAFQYLQTYSFGDNYTFGGIDVGGVISNTMPNPNITWEVAKITNMGFDLSMWRGLLGVTFDYFTQKRSNILVKKQQSIPSTAGFSALPDQNIGKVNNHGFELALTHDSKIGSVGYNLSGNISFARNKIVFMDEVPTAEPYQSLTGRPLGSQLIYNTIGIFKDQAAINAYPHLANTKPGDVILEDYNKDGVINDRDQFMTSRSVTPEIVFGLNAGMNFKSFDFTIFLQGQGNAVLYPGVTGLGGASNQVLFRAEDRWTPDNPTARLPRAGGSFPRLSTLNEYSAAFLRLKNLELGYTIPKKVISKAGIERLRVYVNAYNIYTISELNFMDPEADPSRDNRNDLNNYPQLRTYNVGLNLTF